MSYKNLDQSKLNVELSNWLRVRQSALKIVKTTTTPSGLTLDWIPIESQISTGQIASPPPTDSMPSFSEEPQNRIKMASLELDDWTVERGPAGTVPIVRPNISKLTRTILLKNYLNKSGGLLVNQNRPNKRAADPVPPGYFRVTDNQNGIFYGCDLFLSVWSPSINNPPALGDDHSIMQVWMQNYEKPKIQSIEGGWTVDNSLNGDTIPHIFTYYTTNGYSQDANNLGGYNRFNSGWVQYSPSVFPGIAINGSSTVDGPQIAVSMKFQLYRDPNNGQLNWWIAVQGTWMGYYPASLYNGGLGNKAEWLGFGGEVYSSDPSLTQDQMGSGMQASCGWTKAAFLSNLRNQSNLNGTMQNNNGTPSSDTPPGINRNPYTMQQFINSGTWLESYLFAGGPTREK